MGFLMPSERDIGRNLRVLRGDAPSGRMFDEHGQEIKPHGDEPLPPNRPINILDMIRRKR